MLIDRTEDTASASIYFVHNTSLFLQFYSNNN